MKVPSVRQFNGNRIKGYRPVVVLCLLYKKKVALFYKHEYDLWQFPQGGIENNETLKEAFYRELKEEINPAFTIHDDSWRYIGSNRIIFPPVTKNSRALATDEGVAKNMKGKIYYYVSAQVKNSKIVFTHSEFDSAYWTTYEQAKKKAEQIYQQGKKRITLTALEKLHKAQLIN